ncbi:hypothetical protein DDK01_16535 [Mycobacteroides abscessus]|uniref:FtsK/SpoIIIE domain-containing protein n=1 Tax=Mycobacteroides abscessus TaxID=36809 RepID=UPI000D3E10EE|nr:FtsK/SpoIIIE domain-containing protein [Mycobacteroides abscessus]PVA91593.1 hypothetical protein DDK01_16535 [Mycobacteroides abscessus]
MSSKELGALAIGLVGAVVCSSVVVKSCGSSGPRSDTSSGMESSSHSTAGSSSSGHTVWIVLGLIVLGLFLLWLKRISNRIGRAPAELSQRRPELAAIWEALSGRRTEFDETLLALGVFRRAEDAGVVRPSVSAWHEGKWTDWLDFRPLPGTTGAWQSSGTLAELRVLFAAPGFMWLDSSDVPGHLSLGLHHTDEPAPADPRDVLADVVPARLPDRLVSVHDRDIPPGITVNGTDRGIPMGLTPTRQLIVLDLLSSGHVALQGQTRSGKSAAVYLALAWSAYMRDVQVWGFDPSRVLLGPLDGLPGRRILGDDAVGMATVMRELLALLEERLELLHSSRRDQLDSFSVDLPLVLVVCEEWAGAVKRLEDHDRSTGAKGADRLAAQVASGFSRLLAEGAKVGFRVMTVTQRASVAALGGGDAGDARSNFGLVISLRTDRADSAEMLLGSISAELSDRIMDFRPGEGLWRGPDQPLTFFRACLIGAKSVGGSQASEDPYAVYCRLLDRALKLRAAEALEK